MNARRITHALSGWSLFARAFGFGVRILFAYLPGQTPFGIFGDPLDGCAHFHVGPFRLETYYGTDVR